MGNRLENKRDKGFQRGQGLIGFRNENNGENQDMGCCEQCCE